MSSMILATNPERRVLKASPDLARSVDSTPRFMSGADCACIVSCRNSRGEPLCGAFCPALMAARGRTGRVDGVPIWLESPSRGLRCFNATFQRIDSVPSGMVVAFFGEADGHRGLEGLCAGREETDAPRQQPRLVSLIRGVAGRHGRPSGTAARRGRGKARLRLVGG